MRFRDVLSIVTGRADEHVISLAEQLAACSLDGEIQWLALPRLS